MANKKEKAITKDSLTCDVILAIADTHCTEEMSVEPSDITAAVEFLAKKHNISKDEAFTSLVGIGKYEELVNDIASWLDERHYRYTAEDLGMLTLYYDENYREGRSFNGIMITCIADTKRSNEARNRMSIMFNIENGKEYRADRAGEE